MASEASRVEIGFLDECEPWKLESRFFPSKVGGKPAWLDLKNINIDVKCGNCSKQCILLCQLYAPLAESKEAYHRTIYLFVCRDPDCSTPNDNRNFKVYRCQLARDNEFYSSEEPVEEPEWHPDASVEKYARTCLVCGCFAASQCGKCKKAKYCSREHQLADWRCGHDKKCPSSAAPESSANILFPEYEVVNESEILSEEDEGMLADPDPGEKPEEERLQEYEAFVSQNKAGSLSNVDADAIEKWANVKEDKYFKRFKRRLKICTDQVLRYDRGGEPLWISEPNLTKDKVPDCEICNGPREFEFQILPTLLASLNVDALGKSIDWGVLLVYTCKGSCPGGPSYKNEFLWKQDLT